MKDDPSGGDPSEKTHQKETGPLGEDHPSEEAYLSAWAPNDNRRSN